jgi:hypothetical protein
MKKKENTLTRMYIDRSISACTYKTYENRISTLRSFIKSKNEPDLTLELFAEFLQTLGQRQGNTSKSTADVYRCAIAHFQRAHALWTADGVWADSWEAKRVVAGYGYNGKARQTTATARGQITPQMFLQMMQHANKHFSRFAVALELGYRVALRPHELLSLCAGTFDGTHICIPDKRSRATNNRPKMTYKTVVDPQARTILQTLEAQGGNYFNFSIVSLRAAFKSIATDLQWGTAVLKFDGPHCLRHGGMAHGDALLRLQDRTDEECHQILQVSANTHRRYTRPNDKRGRSTDADSKKT